MKCCGCDQQVFCLKQGSSYLAADGMAICFDSTGCQWPSPLTNPKLVIDDILGNCGCPINGPVEIIGTYTAGAPATVCFDLTAAQTVAMGEGLLRYNYKITASTGAGNPIVLRQGRISVS